MTQEFDIIKSIKKTKSDPTKGRIDFWVIDDETQDTSHAVIHRQYDPAIIEYNLAGEIIRQQWCHEGHPHRFEGPAHIWYRNGEEVKVSWHIGGFKVYFSEWVKAAKDYITEADIVEMKLKYG